MKFFEAGGLEKVLSGVHTVEEMILGGITDNFYLVVARMNAWVLAFSQGCRHLGAPSGALPLQTLLVLLPVPHGLLHQGPPFLPAGQNLSFSGASHWGAASKLLLPERVRKIEGREVYNLFQKECLSPLLCLTD